MLALRFLFPNNVGDPGGRYEDKRVKYEQDHVKRV